MAVGNQAYKLFLGGVAPTTGKEDIEAHFSQYGAIADAVVMYKDGKHRGFGFVTFADEEAVNAALAEPQVIHDRQIDVKLAVPDGQAPPPRNLGGAPPMLGGGKGGGKGGKGNFQGPTDKVFVGGLSPMVTEDMLSEYFGRYGTLTDCVVMKDRMTGKPRGFGFVRYDSNDPVELVMAEYETHEMDGKWVEVKRAVPQDQMVRTLGGKPAMNGGGWGKGGGFGGGFGKGGFGGGKGGFGGGYGGGYGKGKGGGYDSGYSLAFRAPAPQNPYASPYGGKGVYRSRPY